MVIPWCPKTPTDHILGTHNGAFGYACSHGIACHTTISIIWHTKKFNLVKWGVELKMNWLNWSIPISWGFQFQFKIFQFNSNSIHAELNWIDYQFQFNSWIDPSPAKHWLFLYMWVYLTRWGLRTLIYAFVKWVTFSQVMVCDMFSVKQYLNRWCLIQV